MEMNREMFFDWHNLKTNEVVQAIVSNPNYWVQILDYIGEIMRADTDYEHEKRDLKAKYDQEMEELKAKYGVLDD